MGKEIPWVIKYRPKSLTEVINQEQAKKVLIKYVQSFPNYPKKALLLWGPPGTGKTSSVYALANDFGYEVIEVNASDKRDWRSVREIIGNASKHASLFRRKRIILIDEVDGIAGREDAGGVKALIEVIETTKNPLILTANDPWQEKLKPIRELVEMVEFKPLPIREAVRYLQRICEAEGIKADYAALAALIQRNNGDLRAAINDLQALASIKRHITVEDVEFLGQRDKDITIFQALAAIFKATNPFSAMNATNNVPDKDPDEIILWIEENIPVEYKKPHEIWKAYERISKADVWFGRIIRTQYWRFLVYANTLMTAGVALAKDQVYHKWTRYQPPTRLRLLAKAKRWRDLLVQLANRIAEKCHSSKLEAFQDYISLIEIIYMNAKKGKERAKKMWERLKKYYKIDRYEIEALEELARIRGIK